MAVLQRLMEVSGVEVATQQQAVLNNQFLAV